MKDRKLERMTKQENLGTKKREREECVNQYYGSVLLALNSTRPGQKHGIWSQIFNLLEAHLDRPVRPFKKKKASKVVESHASHDESSASCRIVFPFYFPRVLLVNTFAQVCSQHICTVVCSLTHKLCGTHSLSLWHTQTNPGAYVISSMHMIPRTQTHTHTLTKSDCYSWLAVPRSRYQGPRHTKALCHLLCRCSLLLPASQPALRCH